jgi:hypothetical protein
MVCGAKKHQAQGRGFKLRPLLGHLGRKAASGATGYLFREAGRFCFGKRERRSSAWRRRWFVREGEPGTRHNVYTDSNQQKGGGVKRLVFLLAVVGTTLALAAGMALAQATTDKFNEKVPLNQIVFNPCTGEPLQLTGELHILFLVTNDANGGFHVQTQFQPQGVSGTGLVSGEQYRGVGVTREEFNAQQGELREYTLVDRFYLVSTGPSENMLATTTIHVTFNANGEPTAELVRLDTKCAG